MLIREETIADRRPFMAVKAPGHQFLLKYFDRAFNRRITDNIDEADDHHGFVILGIDDHVTDETRSFIASAGAKGMSVTILRVPYVIGTGMEGTMLRLARRVARGSQMQIREDKTLWSVVHATDVAAAALAIARDGDTTPEYIISAPAVTVNDLVDALSHRIKNKRIGTISPRWARLWYGSELHSLLTTDNVVDTSAFAERYPDFTFANPAEYLRTHDYDDDSL